MNWFFGLYKRTNTRMKAVVITVSIVVLAGVCFLLIENKRNRENYLGMYEARQRSYTEQLANGLEQLLVTDQSENGIVLWFSKKADVSANRWSFCIKDEDVLFAKDIQTTENLLETKKKDVFLKQLEEQDALVTMMERQNGYVVGTITAESYAFTEGQVHQHEIFLYLLFAILAMLGVMSVIGVTAKLNQVQKSLKRASRTVKRQNIKLEKSGEQTMSQIEEDEPVPEQETQSLYDAELIRLFLKKSDDQALMPMQIMFADIVMESRYYARQEIFDALEELKQLLGSTHVVGEIQKGGFVVLLYRTTPEEAQSVIEQYDAHMREGGEENATRMELSVFEVAEGRSALEVYEECLKRRNEK